MNCLLFSLIVPTYGRLEELQIFLESLTHQIIGLNSFEVIVIDQNDTIDLAETITKFSNELNIVYINSEVKGLSINRNIGMKISKGKYICFPDDDCQYYPDTLLIAHNFLSDNNSKIDACLGRIYDRLKCINIIKEWPIHSQVIGRYNFFKFSSSITIFCKNDSQYLFDDKLGAGSYFGSCEDADYLINLLSSNKLIVYHPELHVNHPPQTSTTVSLNKFQSYQRGFGAFLRKNFSVSIFYLLIIAIGYYLLQAIKHLFCFRLDLFLRRIHGILSIIEGFYEYKKK